MSITFWGVRGSIPCPGSQTVRYGGNTIHQNFPARLTCDLQKR